MAYLSRLWNEFVLWLSAIAVNIDCVLASVILRAPSKTTITQAAWMAMKRGRDWGCVLCRILHRLDKNHCDKYGKPNGW